MDEKGFAPFAAVGNVANRARVTLEEARAAIDVLEAPDPESSDPEFEGRRLERVPGGWIVLNAEKHRDLVTRAVRQAQTAERVRRHRERKRNSNAAVTPSEAEAGSEAEANTEASNNKLIREEGGSTAKPENAPPASARSKRPIFTGQRLTVFEWMLDDCERILGEHSQAFNLHEWFFTLDAQAVSKGLVISKRDGGEWLQSQLVAEAQSRGIPLQMAKASHEVVGKLTNRMIDMVKRARQEPIHDVRRIR